MLLTLSLVLSSSGLAGLVSMAAGSYRALPVKKNLVDTDDFNVVLSQQILGQ